WPTRAVSGARRWDGSSRNRTGRREAVYAPPIALRAHSSELDPFGEQARSVPRDRPFFVGRHHVHRAGTVVGADDRGVRRVGGRVQADAEVREARADSLTDWRGMLPDASREDERVEAAEGGGQGGGGFGGPVAEHFHGERGVWVGGAGGEGLAHGGGRLGP